MCWSGVIFVSVYCLTKESGRSDCGVGRRRQSFLSSLSAVDTVGKREFDIGLGELHAVRTFQLCQNQTSEKARVLTWTEPQHLEIPRWRHSDWDDKIQN